MNKERGIPPNAKKVLIFGQASHLDWDWLNWFPTNVNNNPPSVIPYWGPQNQPTDTIFTQAAQYLQDPNYGYSVCEMSFLRRFWIDYPDRFHTLVSSPGNFKIVGGGITSPDDLLPHGEGFIRDYLVGVSWLKSVNVSWHGKVWLPDDFGHDSQLPVMLQAMSVTGASFSRVPGGCQQGRDNEYGYTSAHRELLNRKTGGLDFYWQANDGSNTFSYYMPDSYCAADGLYDSNCEATTPEQQADCQCSSVSTVTERINAYLNVREPLHQTPYIYVALGCDFRVPLPNLIQSLNSSWNNNQFPSTGVYAMSSSFDDYVDLVQAYAKQNNVQLHTRNYHGNKPTNHFKPTPYWMGFYTSRVSNKQMHYSTVKNLLASEILLSVARGFNLDAGVTNEDIKSVWNLTAPTTHHDFITGTATDYVVQGEQIPILQNITQLSYNIRTNIFNKIVQELNSAGSSNPSIVAFNPNGFNVDGTPVLASRDSIPDEDFEQLLKSPKVQLTAEGDLITLASAPSLGYRVTSTSALKDFAPATAVKISDADLVLENSFLKATISSTSNWGISALVDKRTGLPVLEHGNVLSFRNDNGNIYRYGYEENCGFSDYNPTITPLSGSIIENGPVRVTAQASIRVQTSTWTNEYTLTYSVVASEPFVRIAVTGAASDYTAVVTNFRFRDQVDFYQHGTPYHWDTKTPFPYGYQSDFNLTIEAVHDYFVPYNRGGEALGAIFHNASLAWGASGVDVVGVILRNSPSDCAGKGAAGHDALTYTITYAVRIPSHLSHPSSGQVLKEARSYNNPAVGYYIGNAQFKTMPPSFSLATLQSPESGIITVAKPGEYEDSSTVFRVYQPTNSAQQVRVTLADTFSETSTAQVVDALEEPLPNKIVKNDGRVEYTSSYAISNFKISK